MSFKFTDNRAQDSKPVILVVDNDKDSRLMFKLLLEIWNYRVIEAADGSDAVTTAEKIRPNLILMDVKLPRLNGFNTTLELRQWAKTENVPVIFLSTCAQAVYTQKASDVVGNEYLTKPLNFDELKNTLGKYIR